MALLQAGRPKQKKGVAPPSDYDALKSDLQGLTLTCVLLGIALTGVFYNKVSLLPAVPSSDSSGTDPALAAMQEIAGSYAVGGLAGFAYMRMLQRSVDAVGAPVLSPQAIVGGALSNNRMLIPFLLTLAYNRCASADAGLSCVMPWNKTRDHISPASLADEMLYPTA